MKLILSDNEKGFIKFSLPLFVVVLGLLAGIAHMNVTGAVDLEKAKVVKILNGEDVCLSKLYKFDGYQSKLYPR